MDTKEAYQIGYDRVRFIACHNVPSLGETYRSESLGKVICTLDNVKEIHESFCFESEMSSRDFSPFEFIAYDFNSEEEDSEELWEAYEKGVADGISEQIESYKLEDYK